MIGIVFSSSAFGCVSDREELTENRAQGRAIFVEGLVQFPRLYSAYDGEHAYRVTPSVPLAGEDAPESERIEPHSLAWTVDDEFVAMERFEALPGAVMLTMKRAGTTQLSVTGKRVADGGQERGEATLEVSQASVEQWRLGDARYDLARVIEDSWPGRPGAQTEGPCGLSVNVDILSGGTACSNCHNAQNPISIEYTPTQTAGFSDDELIRIFSQGEAGSLVKGKFLQSIPMPECIFATMHPTPPDGELTQGLLWKLRSLTPRAQPSVDAERLARASD